MSTQIHVTITLAANILPIEASTIIAKAVEERFPWVVGVDLDAVTRDEEVTE